MNKPTFENPFNIYGVLVVGIDEYGIDSIQELKEIGRGGAGKQPHSITTDLFHELTDRKETK